MPPAGWLIASPAAARRQNLPFCAARSWHTHHRPPAHTRQGASRASECRPLRHVLWPARISACRALLDGFERASVWSLLRIRVVGLLLPGPGRVAKAEPVVLGSLGAGLLGGQLARPDAP